MIKQRLITALILAVVLVSAIFLLDGLLFGAFMGALFLGGVWEWAGFFGYERGPRRLPYVALGAAVMGGVFAWTALFGGPIWPVFAAAALWWLAALAWVIVYPTGVPRAAIFFGGLLTLVPAWLALWVLREAPDYGPYWVLFAFVLVWAADTGAFFAGRTFGRIKLAPAVSPGKTWEGVAGGMALALAVSAVAAVPLGAPLPQFVLLAAGVIAASVLGDLTVSLFKRGAGVKDSGQIFPGHGGILDRIDSLCAAGPLLVLGLMVL